MREVPLEASSRTPPFARWHVEGARPRAVALIIHGLNCRPEKMQGIVDLLREHRVETLNLALRGHGTNFASGEAATDERSVADLRLSTFKSVTNAVWLDEARAAYRATRERGQKLGVPLVLVGYSLGALVGLNLLAELEEPADGMVLFAPALSMNPLTYSLKMLSAFPRLVLPSLSPKQYAANRGTPIAAYNALFELAARLRGDPNRWTRITRTRCIVFIDPKDELVSYRGVVRMVERAQPSHWEILPVRKTLRRGERDYHHLIIDPESVGPRLWAQISDHVGRFLRSLSTDA